MAPEEPSDFDWSEYTEHFSVHYAKGIFEIWKRDRTERLDPAFVLDYPGRKVTMNASLTNAKPGTPLYQLFDDKALKGCTQIPKVDPKQALFPKPGS